MFVYFWLVLLTSLALAQYTVLSPQDNQEFLTGSEITIEVTESVSPPPDPSQTYTMDLQCTPNGSATTPDYAFNTTNQFTIPAFTRGSCVATFTTNSTVFQTLTLVVKQAYVFASNATSGVAGSTFKYEAYFEPRTNIPVVLVELITCPQGSTNFAITLNTGIRQAPIPRTYSGQCYYGPGTNTLAEYYVSNTLAFYVYNALTIEVVSSASVPPGGSTVKLLVHTPTYDIVPPFTLTLTCPIGGSVSQEIVASASSTDYIYFQTGKDQKGNCLFTESGYPDYLQPTTAKFIIIDPLWYYFPIDRLVEFPKLERDWRCQSQSE